MVLNIDKEQGSYICKIEDKIYLLLYKKMNKQELAKAIPIDDIKDNDEYLIAMFDRNGTDYVGSTNYNKINNDILRYNADDFNNFTNEYFLTRYPELTKNDIQLLRIFNETQLK